MQVTDAEVVKSSSTTHSLLQTFTVAAPPLIVPASPSESTVIWQPPMCEQTVPEEAAVTVVGLVILPPQPGAESLSLVNPSAEMSSTVAKYSTSLVGTPSSKSAMSYVLERIEQLSDS